MDFLSGFVFYNVFFFIVLLCFYKGRRKKKIALIGFYLLICLAVLRYDIGYDYDVYFRFVRNISQVSYNEVSLLAFMLNSSEQFYMEPLFIFLSSITSFTVWNPVLVIGFYSLVTLSMFYVSLKRINGLFWGFTIIIMMGYLFISFDQIRQAAAISIFVFSLKYVEMNQWKKYILCIILASLFHVSILIVSPFVYFMRDKPNIKFNLVVLTLCFFLFLTGFFNKIIELIFSLVPFYKSYSGTGFAKVGQFGSGLGLLLKVVFYTLLMVKARNCAPLYSNLIFWGMILLIMASGNLNILRMANYFLFSGYIAFPLCMRMRLRKSHLILLVLMFINLEHNLLTNRGNGCVPYETVLFTDPTESNFKELEPH